MNEKLVAGLQEVNQPELLEVWFEERFKIRLPTSKRLRIEAQGWLDSERVNPGITDGISSTSKRLWQTWIRNLIQIAAD